jgi:glycosyltransferase involved in cell wall biosynthesis
MREKYQKAGIDLKYMDRMTVIHNGNDMQRYKKEEVKAGQFRAKYNIDADTKIISYVGRLSSEKRPIVFVDIAEKVLKSLPQEKIKFVMAGDGVYRKAVEARIKQLGLEKHFLLTGVVTSDDVRELLADAFLVLITSYMEGLPLVAVEAMSMQVPVISTDVGSIKEAVQPGVSGFLVHPQHKVVENFSEAICRLCSSKELYESIVKNTRGSVEKEFSFETFAERYTQVFSELSKELAK